MSRRIAVLLAAGALGLTAGAAFAMPPPGQQPAGGGNEPADPVPATLCQQLPHPVAACSAVAVVCPSSPKAEFACTTSASSGPADASTRMLELQLPRRYPRLALLCQVKTATAVTCRVTSRTITRMSGKRLVVLTLPNRSGPVRIACATTTRFACKTAK
jgi:hypothetical protein